MWEFEEFEDINSLCDVTYAIQYSSDILESIKDANTEKNYDNVLNELNILSSDFLH